MAALYNVFDTEAEAIAAEGVDYQMHIADRSDVYIDQTTRWAKVVQRETDGKWIYPVCPTGVQTHTQEELQDDWFSEEEF